MKIYEKDIVLKRFPKIELSYVKTIHNKVYSDIVLAIPYGKKYYAWFSYYKKDFVCFFLEIARNNDIYSISIHPVCFHKDLAKNIGASIVVGIGKKKDNTHVGYIYEIIPANGIVEAVILESPEIATNHKLQVQNAKMNGMTLIDSLQQFHKKNT